MSLPFVHSWYSCLIDGFVKKAETCSKFWTLKKVLSNTCLLLLTAYCFILLKHSFILEVIILYRRDNMITTMNCVPEPCSFQVRNKSYADTGNLMWHAHNLHYTLRSESRCALMVLEVMSTSVYTGLNLFNLIHKYFLQICLWDVSYARSYCSF